MNKAKLLAAVAALGLWVLPSDATFVAPNDAANHVGQNATVCGVVALTNFDADTQFWPTFLDFGGPYPNQVFTAVIYGADRAKFGTRKTTMQGKLVCVTGQIREGSGQAQNCPHRSGATYGMNTLGRWLSAALDGADYVLTMTHLWVFD